VFAETTNGVSDRWPEIEMAVPTRNVVSGALIEVAADVE
jgi:hypothetical protein